MLLTCLFFAAAGQWELIYFGFRPDSPRLRPRAFRAGPSAISPSIVLALCVPNGHALAAQFRLLLFAILFRGPIVRIALLINFVGSFLKQAKFLFRVHREFLLGHFNPAIFELFGFLRYTLGSVFLSTPN